MTAAHPEESVPGEAGDGAGFPLDTLVPPPAGGLFGEWWAGTERRQLLVQRCGSCGAAQHYPRPVCGTCSATELSMTVAAGDATLYSYTTVWRPPHPGLAAPYVVALVRLAEGPLLVTRLVGTGEESLSCDQPLRLEWAPLADGRALPVFSPTTPAPPTQER
ncbi:MAG: Zn-ribbon domain-containing OB-fold protein [Acidimicrobiales bacterium]